MTEHGQALATERDVSLVEILDRALGSGLVITGDVTISLADVDLVYLDLRLLLGSVGTIRGGEADAIDTAVVAAGRQEDDWP